MRCWVHRRDSLQPKLRPRHHQVPQHRPLTRWFTVVLQCRVIDNPAWSHRSKVPHRRPLTRWFVAVLQCQVIDNPARSQWQTPANQPRSLSSRWSIIRISRQADLPAVFWTRQATVGSHHQGVLMWRLWVIPSQRRVINDQAQRQTPANRPRSHSSR